VTERELQASRLIHTHGRDGALKAARKNMKKAVSEAQEDFWQDVLDLIEETRGEPAEA
jgi:hypothetical protein